MAASTSVSVSTEAEARGSWLPLIVVVLTQIQASFAVNALTVSIAGISGDLDMPPTSIGTAITAGTFAMAAFILLGAKIGAKFGSLRVFQVAVAIHAVAMATVALSVSAGMLFVAQAASGAVIALIAPSLTVFIATNYKGKQQAQAIGYLAAAIPAAGVLALLIAGSLAGVNWRLSFGLVAALGVVNLVLSTRLKKVEAKPGLVIDKVGALLSASSIIMLSFGFSGLNAWGPFLATDDAPFDILGVSPSPILIVLGIVLAQAFFRWTASQQQADKPVLFSLEVLDTAAKKATTFCMATMLFIGTAANFLIPLYMQVVQGLSGIQTSFSIIPYTLSIFVANSLVARSYDRFSPRQLAIGGFLVVATALTILAFSIRNDWGQVFVVLGLITLGLGQGVIVALVFNTLLASNRKDLAGDVGAWRGLVHNTSGSIGIALATAFAVGILGSLLLRGAIESPVITQDVIEQVNFDRVNFFTNDELEQILKTNTTASEEQIAKAVKINEDARLRALKVSLLVLATIALLAIVPATKMPGGAEVAEEQPVTAPAVGPPTEPVGA